MGPASNWDSENGYGLENASQCVTCNVHVHLSCSFQLDLTFGPQRCSAARIVFVVLQQLVCPRRTMLDIRRSQSTHGHRFLNTLKSGFPPMDLPVPRRSFRHRVCFRLDRRGDKLQRYTCLWVNDRKKTRPCWLHLEEAMSLTNRPRRKVCLAR